MKTLWPLQGTKKTVAAMARHFRKIAAQMCELEMRSVIYHTMSNSLEYDLIFTLMVAGAYIKHYRARLNTR